MRLQKEGRVDGDKQWRTQTENSGFYGKEPGDASSDGDPRNHLLFGIKYREHVSPTLSVKGSQAS